MDNWIEVAYDLVSDEALQALLEEACTRDGTELTDATIKVGQLREGLRCGRIQLRFYPAEECCHLVWTNQPSPH